MAPRLEELKLRLGPNELDFDQLPKALLITKLSLEGSNWTDTTAAALVAHCPKLQELQIEDCPVGSLLLANMACWDLSRLETLSVKPSSDACKFSGSMHSQTCIVSLFQLRRSSTACAKCQASSPCGSTKPR